MSTDSVLRAMLGGVLIGTAAALVLVFHGRVAGISGTLGRVLARDGGSPFRVAFLLGLVASGLVLGQLAPATLGAPIASVGVLAVAGVLVGVGTTLANGCTSGHGVCGVSRGSRRSLVATATFMATGAITVAIVGALS